MTDFWLVQTQTQACMFMQDILTLTQPNYKNWRATWHSGQHLLSDDDIIAIIPLDAAFQRAQLMIRSLNRAVHINIEIQCAIPDFAGAAAQIHFAVGTAPDGAKIYVYKLDDSAGGPSILLQRFVAQNDPHLPNSKDVVKYEQPLAALAAGAGGVAAGSGEQIIPTQNDQGTGRPPIP